MAAWHSVAGHWVSRETALLLVLMATLPLWIGPVGLYQYLGIEIAIWMIYGLGYNLLLGYSGLPSFGHGAFFGIGAYAFGLFQLRVFESLWLGMFCAIVAAAVAGAFVACFPRIGAASTSPCSPSPSARCSGSSPSSGTPSPEARTGS